MSKTPMYVRSFTCGVSRDSAGAVVVFNDLDALSGEMFAGHTKSTAFKGGDRVRFEIYRDEP